MKKTKPKKKKKYCWVVVFVGVSVFSTEAKAKKYIEGIVDDFCTPAPLLRKVEIK